MLMGKSIIRCEILMDFLPILYRPEFDYKLPQCINIFNTKGTYYFKPLYFLIPIFG